MTVADLISRDFSPEFRFSASRSSGAGGQNVNKVNTRMELRFDISASTKLSEEEKALLLEKLAGRINADNELLIVSQTERNQLGNKEKTLERFYILLAKALTPRRPRRATRPTLASKERRITDKKILSEKKQRRGNLE
ncbi:MAG: alternative ribosome rescue aminoacyl-tRNA hydrolase ArfB [Bacteroidales bacterium]|jgi:ribosome-associated protein